MQEAFIDDGISRPAQAGSPAQGLPLNLQVDEHFK